MTIVMQPQVAMLSQLPPFLVINVVVVVFSCSIILLLKCPDWCDNAVVKPQQGSTSGMLMLSK